MSVHTGPPVQKITLEQSLYDRIVKQRRWEILLSTRKKLKAFSLDSIFKNANQIKPFVNRCIQSLQGGS